MEKTQRLGLPLLVQGQGQKDITHNEALLALDSLTHLVLQDVALPQPPEILRAGDCWSVPEGAGGAWEGHAGEIAVWGEGGWRFYRPANGMTAWLAPENRRLRRDGDAWEREAPVQLREPAIPAPSGGPVVDSEARAAIASLLLALGRLGLIGD